MVDPRIQLIINFTSSFNLISLMKKLLLLLTMAVIGSMVMAAHVPMQDARQLAIAFYRNNGPTGTGPVVSDEIATTCNQVETFYTFRFTGGGFVIVAADDASIPILGYSFTDDMPAEVTNPNTRYWLDNYSQEIYRIITRNLDNRETLKEWDAVRHGMQEKSTLDVNPLLTTMWDQGCYYNAMCPADAGACGHTWTGCVATTMAQIMKYHNFPPQGVGSHSYVHPTYGLQSADFGNTTYSWSSMPNQVFSANTAVATLMYHAGVSVDMQYGTGGSGAFSYNVPDALMNYFNYRPGAVLQYKNSFSNVEDFKNLIRADLDQDLPVYYSGVDGNEGHAWVCDGYRMSDGKFHFNWGWSGSSNGWYAIGALNPGGYSFNTDNQIVIHIKPYNPDLIVRISHPANNTVVGVGYPAGIVAKTVHGTPAMMKLFIDNVEKYSVNSDSLDFTWNTSSSDLGSHVVRVYSYSATDTVYYEINLNVAEWITQNTAFATPQRGINYMSAVDSNIVWASAYDGSNQTGPCPDFSRSIDGGTTWTPGAVTNSSGLASSMIFAVSADKAYIVMFRASGSSPQGIFVTEDGGTTWTRQSTASFSNGSSFPNCVHFFNASEGWCMGDPINGVFEIYTTTDGGNTWSQVSGSSIPDPAPGEFGIVGYYSAVNDTIWFGTSAGRVYRSPDKGHTWTVSSVPALSGKYVKPTFRNGMHGLVQDKGNGTTGAICESFDGGQTWTPVTVTGPIYATDLSYVPGTENTWVSAGGTGYMGSSYSFDGGHTWTDFIGTQGAQYMQMTWLNNHCGWAGGVNVSATEGGAYKFIGLLNVPLPAPLNLQATVTGHDVDLSWNAPATGTPVGYNMYRNGQKINSSPVAGLAYNDISVVSGHYTYCVTALYQSGESAGSCTIVDVAVGIEDQPGTELRVCPNPVTSLLQVYSGSETVYSIRDITGREVKTGHLVSPKTTIDVTDLRPGVYFLGLSSGGRPVKFIRAE